jgi:hypothetical protein
MLRLHQLPVRFFAIMPRLIAAFMLSSSAWSADPTTDWTGDTIQQATPEQIHSWLKTDPHGRYFLDQWKIIAKRLDTMSDWVIIVGCKPIEMPKHYFTWDVYKQRGPLIVKPTSDPQITPDDSLYMLYTEYPANADVDTAKTRIGFLDVEKNDNK